MSIEQFEEAMVKAGYDEEQIANIKAKLEECTQLLVLTFEEIVDRFMEIMASVWEGVKETLKELADKLRDVLDIPNERTKVYVSYNPPRSDTWYNQYTRAMMVDKRKDMEYFVRHRY